MNLHNELKETFTAWIGRFGQVTELIGISGLQDTLCKNLDEAFSDPRIKIVVCGEWSTGKSTLINGLVGKPGLLPADIEPCTSYITVVERGDSECYEILRKGTVASLARQDFLDLTASKEGDPSIDSIRVTAVLPWPTEQVVIVDTPGIEDIAKTRSDVTLSFLPQADVIVLVMSIVTGVKESVLNFICNHLTAHEQRRVILVLNQKDHLNTDDEISRRVIACQTVLQQELPDAFWVATDASLAEKTSGGGAVQESGILALRDAIVRLVRRERLVILGQRFIRHAQSRVDDVKCRLVSEESSLSLSLVEAEKRLADFRKQISETSRQNDDAFRKARALIVADVDCWLKNVPDRVQSIQDKAVACIQGLDDYEAIRAYVDTDELGRKLAQELRVLNEELNDMLGKAISRAGNAVLTEQIVMPSPIEVTVDGRLPPIKSIFRKVPIFVVDLLKLLLVDVQMRDSSTITNIFARIVFGSASEFLKKLEFLGKLTPMNLLRQSLQSAAVKSLSAFCDNIVPALRAAAQGATQDVLEEIRSLLEHRIAAVEAGLDDARIKLSEDRSRVEARRVVLAEGRQAIERLSDELSSLAR